MSKQPKTKIPLHEIEQDLVNLTKDDNPFPIEVFPNQLQSVIRDYSLITGAPACFLGGAMLAVAGTAFGNSLRLLYGNYSANGVLFLCVVARRGMGKSHPLDFILKPLKNIDKKLWNAYKHDNIQWKQRIAHDPKDKQAEPAHPPIFITTDSTPEALIGLHENNPKSLLIHRDELSGLVASLDQYSKGGESQKYLQIWSGSTISVARKGSGVTRIDNPYISILGGIQPEILYRLAEKSRIADGFLDRFLFCFPKICQAQPENMEEVNSRAWEDCITKIAALQPYEDSENNEKTPHILRLSAEARRILAENSETLRSLITRTSNNLDDPSSGIAAKLRIYQYRFALVLHTIEYGCNSRDNLTEVSAASAIGAVKLTEYFLNTALKVHSQISEKAKRAYNIRRVHKLLDNGKPVREISELLDISTGTVSNYSKLIP